jgi:hypothetical protein
MLNSRADHITAETLLAFDYRERLTNARKRRFAVAGLVV